MKTEKTRRKTIHTDEYRQLLETLAALRRKAGLTQRGLAEKLGVHHSWVAKVEIGERRLDVLETIRIIKALDGDPVKVIRTLLVEPFLNS